MKVVRFGPIAAKTDSWGSVQSKAYQHLHPPTTKMASTYNTYKQRQVLKAQQQKEEAQRKQTEKTETNFPTLVTTAHRISTNAPQGFAQKADEWRIERELKTQLDAYRKAKTARERRAILNTVFIFQRGRRTESYDEDDYEDDYEDEEELTLEEQFPPHGRRGTYTEPDAEGWRTVTRLPFRPPRGELTEEQLHQLYVSRGNQADDEDEADLNGDLTDRNQRREFY